MSGWADGPDHGEVASVGGEQHFLLVLACRAVLAIIARIIDVARLRLKLFFLTALHTIDGRCPLLQALATRHSTAGHGVNRELLRG